MQNSIKLLKRINFICSFIHSLFFAFAFFLLLLLAGGFFHDFNFFATFVARIASKLPKTVFVYIANQRNTCESLKYIHIAEF